MGLHTSDAPPFPKPPLATMMPISTKRARPDRIAITLKKRRALAVDTGSLMSVTLGILSHHPEPHERGKAAEDPPLQRVCRVAPLQPARHLGRWHPYYPGRG